MYRSLGQPEEALAAARKVAEADPDDALAALDVAELALETGGTTRPRRRSSGCGEIVDLPEDEVGALQGMIRVELARGDTERALELAREAAAIDTVGPHDRRARAPRGRDGRGVRRRTTPVARGQIGGVRAQAQRGAADAAQEVERADRRDARGPAPEPWRASAVAEVARTEPRGVRRVAALPVLRGVRLPQAPEAQPARLPRVQPPLPAALRDRARPASRRGQLRGAVSGDLEPHRRALLRRLEALSGADRGGAEARPGAKSGALYGTGTIDGHPLVVAGIDFDFIGGSMGGAVGEAITRAAELALETRIPLLVISASGGARMQEGCVSLMQMAKTSQAIGRLNEEGILYISLLTDPTYGGVSASFATLGDVLIAEPERPHRLRRPVGDRADDPPDSCPTASRRPAS